MKQIVEKNKEIIIYTVRLWSASKKELFGTGCTDAGL